MNENLQAELEEYLSQRNDSFFSISDRRQAGYTYIRLAMRLAAGYGVHCLEHKTLSDFGVHTTAL